MVFTFPSITHTLLYLQWNGWSSVLTFTTIYNSMDKSHMEQQKHCSNIEKSILNYVVSLCLFSHMVSFPMTGTVSFSHERHYHFS